MSKDLRCNEQIRISPIRLIDDENNQLGIVDTKESLAKARAVGLDLVEVDPHSRPPVCRIMDYGKWKYAQRKKEQKSKAHRHETELKEIRIKTPKIGDHDLGIKIVHARDFLKRGDRVQFSLRFRGRELAHLDEGRKIFEMIKAELAEVAKVETDARYEAKRITMLLAPGVGGVKPAAPAAKPASKPAAGGTVPPRPASAAPAGAPAPAKPAAPASAPAATPAPVAPNGSPATNPSNGNTPQ